MAELNENIKESYYYKENVEPVLSSIESIKDQKVKKSINEIVKNFNQETSEEELLNYMKDINTILIKHDTQKETTLASTQIQTNKLQEEQTQEEQTNSSSSSEFEWIVDPETWKIPDSESGVLWTATWVVAGFADAWEQGKSAVKEKLNLGGEESIEIDQEKAKQFAKLFLESNDWTIDYWFQKIESLLKNAETLNENDLADEIQSLDIFFDIEPEDWDKYFKDNNIPEDKQLEFKRFFTELSWKNQDGWNFFFKDFWKQINDEVERIMLLPADQTKEIVINISSINPWEQLKFDNKKDALLYLYYNKLLLREVWTSVYDVIIWAKNTASFISNIPEFISNHPTELIWALWALVSYSLFTISYRHVNKFLLKNTWNWWENFLTFWKLLDEWWSWNINANNEEVRELEKRKEKIEELKKVYWNDPKMEKLIKDAEKWIFIADGTSTNKREWSIFRIISRAWFPESTFWRKVTYIENGWIWYNKYSDLFKPILLNTEYWGSKKTEIINKVRSEIFDSNWEVKKWTYFDNLRRYIEFSHKIDNSMEDSLKTIIDDYEKKLKDWNFLKLLWKNKDQTENNIRQAIFDDLRRIYPTISTNLFRENWFTNFADDFRNLNEFKVDFVNNLTSQWISINSTKKAKLESFFRDCKSWRQTFDRWAAIDIILRILNWDEINDAIKNSRESLTQENINSLNDKNKGLSEIIALKYWSYDFWVSIDRKREIIFIDFDEEYRKIKASVLNSNQLTDIERKNLLKEVDELYRSWKITIWEIDLTNYQNKFDELNNKKQEFLNNLPKDWSWVPKVNIISDLSNADNIISNPPKKRKRDTLKSVWNKIVDTWIKSKNTIWNAKDKVSEYFVNENKIKLKNRALASLEISTFSDTEKKEKMKKILKFDKKISDYETKINSLFDVSNPLKSEQDLKNYFDVLENEKRSLKRYWLDFDIDTSWKVKIKKDIWSISHLNDKEAKLLNVLRIVAKNWF